MLFFNRKYKKYRKELSAEEELTFFAFKIVGATTVYFLAAFSIDTYRIFHGII